MMRPLNLREFAERLRMEGNEFADEILELCDLEDETAEPYYALCDDLEHYAPDALKGNVQKQLEWLVNRSNLLKEIEDELRDAGHEPEGTRDTADVVKELVSTLGDAEDILEAAGWSRDGDFLEAIQVVADASPALFAPIPEYDL